MITAIRAITTETMNVTILGADSCNGMYPSPSPGGGLKGDFSLYRAT
jgi:hypothetical protein